MVKRLSFVLCCLLSLNASYGASHRTLSRQESKDIASKTTRILTKEEYPILEKALERTLISQPNYNSDGLQEERAQNIDKLSRIQQDDLVEENLKSELMQWAIKELAERNTHECAQKNDEKKKKWIAATIGLVTTIISVAVPIIFSEDCDCPSDG